MTLSRGIDVSHHQGSVDWSALKAAHGLSWGAAKASEGTTFFDSYFTANWSRMKDAGLVRMAYHYGRPAKSAVDQARLLVHLANPDPGDVLCLDLETGDGLSQGTVNAWARTFGTTLRAEAPGVATVLYAGSGYALTGTGKGLSAFFDYWWYPRYATMNPVTVWPTSMRSVGANTTGWAAPHLWQWAASLRTSSGLVDASVASISAAQLATPTREVDPMAGITLDQIARAVWLTKTKVLGNPAGEAVITGLGRMKRTQDRHTAQIAALQAQVTALSTTVPAGVEQALKDKVLTVDVNVNGASK